MDIIGYEGFYKIYDDGRVFSVRSDKFIKPFISRGYYINYEFYVDNKKYKGSQKLEKKDLTIKKGDKFLVEFAKKNPDYNKVDLNKKIEND